MLRSCFIFSMILSCGSTYVSDNLLQKPSRLDKNFADRAIGASACALLNNTGTPRLAFEDDGGATEGYGG
jgi:hypothetical protein